MSSTWAFWAHFDNEDKIVDYFFRTSYFFLTRVSCMVSLCAPHRAILHNINDLRFLPKIEFQMILDFTFLPF